MTGLQISVSIYPMSDYKLKGYLCKKNNGDFYVCLSWYENKKHIRKNVSLPPNTPHNKAQELKFRIVSEKQKELDQTALNALNPLLIPLLQEIQTSNLSDESIRLNTRYKYDGFLSKYIKFLIQLEESNQQDIKLSNDNLISFLTYLHNIENLSVETIKAYKAYLFRVINNQKERFGLSPLPDFKVDKMFPRSNIPKRTRLYFTEDEIRQIDEYLNTHTSFKTLYPIFRTCIIFGLRRSEVLGLTWDNVDFTSNIFTIKHTRVRANNEIIDADQVKARGSYRSYPISPILNIISDIKEQQLSLGCYESTGHVFLNNSCLPWSPDYCSKKLKIAIKKCGLDSSMSFKYTRSTCACLLLANDATDSQIIDYLGHMDISTTRAHYMENTLAVKNNISSQISNIFCH